MCKITDWYFVAKERFGYDLSYSMPYSIIRKNSNFEPVLIGKMDGMEVIIDNIKSYNEVENCVIFGCENDTKVYLENMHNDFFELQDSIVKGRSVIYDWTVDENLNISGIIFSKGHFEFFKDTITAQEGNTLSVKNLNSKVFVLWSAMSKEQRKYMSTLTDQELLTFAPDGNFKVDNCKLNLLMLIKNKEERERKNKVLKEVDVPDFFKK